jgi:hypothetical protein
LGSMTISLIAFVCSFGGALLGLFLRSVLPEHHLSDKTRDAVKVGTGLIATLTALVLGLLISSAKSSFDMMSDEIKQSGARVILIDRTLAHYGPETKEARDLMRFSLASLIDQIWPEDKTIHADLKAVEKGSKIEELQDKLRTLSPKNDSQRLLQAQALQICGDLAQSRWLLIEQSQSSLPSAFLVVLVFWLTIFFICFGLFSEPNATVIAVMLVCALSVSGAIFLILEMNSPLEGIIKVSSAPLHKALEHLGQ